MDPAASLAGYYQVTFDFLHFWGGWGFLYTGFSEPFSSYWLFGGLLTSDSDVIYGSTLEEIRGALSGWDGGNAAQICRSSLFSRGYRCLSLWVIMRAVWGVLVFCALFAKKYNILFYQNTSSSAFRILPPRWAAWWQRFVAYLMVLFLAVGFDFSLWWFGCTVKCWSVNRIVILHFSWLHND